MPLYEYRCSCGRITQKVRVSTARNKTVKCLCGGDAKKIISVPSLVTDTNFGYTGKFDPRLGGPKIEGRKDFWNRVKQKGLREVCLKELTDRPKTMEKRLENVAIN